MKKAMKSMAAIVLSIAVAVSMIPASSLFSDGSAYAADKTAGGSDKVIVKTTDKDVMQVKVGKTLDISDCVKLSGTEGADKQDQIKWEIVGEADDSGAADILGYADNSRQVLKAKAAGEADVWAYTEGDINTGVMFHVVTYKSLKGISNTSKPTVKSTVPSTGAVKSGDSKPVARLTIAAYPGSRARLMPHGFLTLTTYKDITMDVSYYIYFKPNSKYSNLLRDYKNHPEKYSSDPVLYNNDDLKIKDRESYFSSTINGPYSKPAKVSLRAGESLTMSNSAYGEVSIDYVIAMLEDSTISSSKATKELIEELKHLVDKSGSFSLRKALAGGVRTLIRAYRTAILTGHNPIDGRDLEGGLMVNRELHDQFTSKVARLPNNYYTVEITAGELAILKTYISNPDINYFSFFDNNCTAQTTHIWNATLSDRPELNVKANYTKFCIEPESLFVELGLLRLKKGLDGEGGRNFTPRSLAYKAERKANPIKVTGKKVKVKYSKLKKKAQTIKRSKAITVKNAKGTVTYKKTYGKAKITVNKKTGKITVKKGLKKGTYKVKVKVRAAGNSQYKAGTKTATVRIQVR